MANEKRLIDANVLIDWLSKHTGFRSNCEDCTDIDCLDCIIENAIKNAPTVDAVEVVHGRWKQARYTEAPLYICSVCDKPEYKQHRYCPHCDAKMDGDGNA